MTQYSNWHYTVTMFLSRIVSEIQSNTSQKSRIVHNPENAVKGVPFSP